MDGGKKLFQYFFAALIVVQVMSCGNDKKNTAALFQTMTDKETGLHFTNKLTASASSNIFHYIYFYNGSGVGAGDFNNDGLIDLFFAANQGDNKLFLNEGKLRFKETTKESMIPQDGGWSTGVSVADVNNDGLLDIYVCRVGNFGTLAVRNQLLICKMIGKDGVPVFEDEAHQYGLDFSGLSTQAVFFDYDMDGDLDMFLLNHSGLQNGTFVPRDKLPVVYSPLSDDRLYRNDGDHFTDVTNGSGITSSNANFGLGIVVSDINMDGWPDLYIGNDFQENDFLYINQKNGTFAEESNKRMMHSSHFSMGVDAADINNDGFPEIISMDMLAYDPNVLKRSIGEDDYDAFYNKINHGYSYQYTRNNLQYNRKNGMFSETGLYSGVYATDWSWGPLWMDFDNDGLKDLFVTNGIAKRLNDLDYVNFVSSDEIQQKIRENKIDEKDMALVNKFPEVKIPNKFYKNDGELIFRNIADSIRDDKPSYSNGAVYADLDNDGDLDVAVNNINDPALVYANKSNDSSNKAFVEIKLKGPAKNTHALGAKVILFANGGIRTYEKYPVKGFMSSMEEPLLIGLDKTKTDSAFLIWPDNSFQTIQVKNNQHLSFSYTTGLPQFDYAKITSFHKNETKPMEDITGQVNLAYKHKENFFMEFNMEPLIPHMISTEGPALAVADINHDGLEDIFIGASLIWHNGIFLQQPNGKFIQKQQLGSGMLPDSLYEDVDAVWTDVNNDGNLDLVVVSGGNQYYGNNEHLLPRVYLNNGAASFTKKEGAFNNLYQTFSCVAPYDFNGDGFVDLFIGGRALPGQYGQIPHSYLLQNDGTGKFSDVTEKYSAELATIGMVTNAVWYDIDKDGDKDLLVCCEWGGIYAFINDHGKFTKKSLTDKKGWWNFILPVDIDNDGDMDLVAGNLGLNSRLTATVKEPVRLYYNDFDNNGKKEQVLSYYVQGKELPFANKDELEKQMPILKKKFLYAEDFAKATMSEIFSADKLKNAEVLTADYFSSAILINDGQMNFTVKALPFEAQLSSFRDATVADMNGDSLPDILLAGNFYENNIQMSRYDADFGTILVNKGHGVFTTENINGLQVKGQVRHVRPIIINKKEAFVLARNNDSTMVIGFKKGIIKK